MHRSFVGSPSRSEGPRFLRMTGGPSFVWGGHSCPPLLMLTLFLVPTKPWVIPEVQIQNQRQQRRTGVSAPHLLAAEALDVGWRSRGNRIECAWPFASAGDHAA